MNFVTFIRNETKMAFIRDKNGHFVTNPDKDFWRIMVIVKKFTELFQSRKCDKKSHLIEH